MARTHRIAVLPGDGIGKETVPESLKVLDAASRKFGFGLELTHYDWSCETYKATGLMMPADGLDQLAKSGLCAVGRGGAGRAVPDHVSLWGLLIPIRRGFDQYVNLRPCKLLPGVRTPLANRTEADIDFYVVRENTEGEYSSVGGRMFEGTDREFVSQQSVFSRVGTDRILKFAVRAGDDQAEEAFDPPPPSRMGSSIRCPCIGMSGSPPWGSRIRRSGPTSFTSTFCARISCSIRTGSMSLWDRTCSATY